MTLGIEEDPGQEELRSLHEWLLTDTGARRFGHVEWAASEPAPGPAPDEPHHGGVMSGALDVITLVLGSGFSAAALAVQIAQWRGTRAGGGPAVTVEHPDGRKVTVTASTAEETERLLLSLGVTGPGIGTGTGTTPEGPEPR